MKKILKIVLILLPVLLFAAIYIPWHYLNAVEYASDDLTALAQQKPMESALRFSFHAEEKTMQMRITKADICRYFAAKTELPLEEALAQQLAPYGLSADSFSFDIEEGGIEVRAGLRWKNTVPLPLHFRLELSQSGGGLSLTAGDILIAEKLKKPAAELLPAELLCISVDLSCLHPFFKTIRSVETKNGEFLLTLPLPEDWLMAELPKTLSDYTLLLDFVRPEEISSLLQTAILWGQGDKSSVQALFARFEQDPSAFAACKTELLALGGSYTADCYFRESEYAEWLFPEITPDIVRRRRLDIAAAGQKLYNQRIGQLAEIEWDILQLYASGGLKVQKGAFVYSYGGAFTLDSIGSAAGLSDWLDMESLRPILATNPGDYMKDQLKKGKTVPVLICRTYTGRPVVCFHYTADMFKITSLGEDDYQLLLTKKTVPTFDLGMPTTK